MTAENRSATRHSVKLSVNVACEGETSQQHLLNIALGGAMLSFPNRLPIGQRIGLIFTLPGQKKELDIQATVRWSSDDCAGLQFDGLRAQEVWTINEFLKNLES